MGHSRTIGGIYLGAIANFSKTSSFFSRSLGDCFTFSQVASLGPLNRWRESLSLGLLFHALPPLQVIPASLLAIGNSFKKESDGSRTPLSVIKNVGINLHNFVLSPTLYHISAENLSSIFRVILQRQVDPFGIDISGHVRAHSLYLIHIYHSLSAISEVGGPIQSALATLPFAALSLIEVPWMYNTTANCHSVADTAIGLTLGIGSYWLLKKGIVPLISRVPCLLFAGCKKLMACSKLYRKKFKNRLKI